MSETFSNRGVNYEHLIDCVSHAYTCALVKTSLASLVSLATCFKRTQGTNRGSDRVKLLVKVNF